MIGALPDHPAQDDTAFIPLNAMLFHCRPGCQCFAQDGGRAMIAGRTGFARGYLNHDRVRMGIDYL